MNQLLNNQFRKCLKRGFPMIISKKKQKNKNKKTKTKLGYIYMSIVSETSLLLLLQPLLLSAEKKKVSLFFLFIIIIIIIITYVLHRHGYYYNHGDVSCGKQFVCLFVLKIQRAHCPKSLYRRCQRRGSQYLSLLRFHVYLFIYWSVCLCFWGYFLSFSQQIITK